MMVRTRERQYLGVLPSQWQVVAARQYMKQGHILNILDFAQSHLQTPNLKTGKSQQ
jgi:hypothetical protein